MVQDNGIYSFKFQPLILRNQYGNDFGEAFVELWDFSTSDGFIFRKYLKNTKQKIILPAKTPGD